MIKNTNKMLKMWEKTGYLVNVILEDWLMRFSLERQGSLIRADNERIVIDIPSGRRYIPSHYVRRIEFLHLD